jgi:hypothetical protein
VTNGIDVGTCQDGEGPAAYFDATWRGFFKGLCLYNFINKRKNFTLTFELARF